MMAQAFTTPPRRRILPAQQLSFLAFDFGQKRTGVASGNRIAHTAQALTSIHAEQTEARFAQIQKLIAQWQPDALVVGIPAHPDGTAHEMTRLAQKFARQLAGRFALPVHEVDERYSSVEAESRHAQDVDAEAAAILLEQFFSELQESAT